MATEHATVTIASEEGTWVEATPSAACEGCASRGSCHAVGKEKNSVQVINRLDAHVGDTVVITFETGSLLKALFLLYMVPILALLAGACAGNWLIAPAWGKDPSFISAASGFICFFAAIWVAKQKAGRMEKREAYQPKITRIARRATVRPDSAVPVR
ncbi:MAG: SoxR reducing system RseC family protein [Desulfobacterales bacterium]|nr:SoxR reducing system RseC family protein [Desulfobacterales bacterium]